MPSVEVEQPQAPVATKPTVAPQRRTVTLFAASMLFVALASGGGGYAAGYLTAPTTMDMDAEIAQIERVCSQDDLETGDGPLSEACERLVTSRVRALEELVHNSQGSTLLSPSFNSTRRGRQLWWSSSRDADKCDGTWDSGAMCCRNNRPGGLTGPSPICRMGIMHGCGCSDGVCETTYFHCSWWNGFCWAFCSSYDEVDYCGWCGNSM